jgi:hypothetical protein
MGALYLAFGSRPQPMVTKLHQISPKAATKTDAIGQKMR